MDCTVKVHYAALPDDLPHFPDDRQIIDLCDRVCTGRNTLRVSESTLVKSGNVSLEECRNQIEARRLLDPRIVVVPKVYRYFSTATMSYLVMEFIEGVVKDLIEDGQSVTKIAQIVKHLQAHKSGAPGPLGGGVSRGLFWENEEVKLESISRLEYYINRRIIGEQKNLCLKINELVMNHNDLAPRNIIWTSDGSICLIDWSHAGYYPRLLERVVLSFNTQQGKDENFAVKLQEKLGPLTEDEMKDLHAIHMAWFNSHRYAIKPLDDQISRWPESAYMPPRSDQGGEYPLFSPHRAVPAPEIMNARAFSDRLWEDLQNTQLSKNARMKDSHIETSFSVQ